MCFSNLKWAITTIFLMQRSFVSDTVKEIHLKKSYLVFHIIDRYNINIYMADNLLSPLKQRPLVYPQNAWQFPTWCHWEVHLQRYVWLNTLLMNNNATVSLGIILNQVSKYPFLSDQVYKVLIHHHVFNIDP